MSKKVRLARGRVLMAPPVAQDDAVYVGWGHQEIVKLDRGELSPRWRIDAEGYEPLAVRQGRLILIAPSGAARAMDAAGKPVWLLERKGQGWALWGDRLMSVDEGGITVADPGSGEVVQRIAGPLGKVKSEAVCGDILVFRRDPAETFHAFDLVRKEFLWERPLLAEIKQTYGVSENSPILSIVEGGPGRFIGSRGGNLFSFSVDDGRLLWRAPVVVPYHFPDVHDGRIYVWSYVNEPPPRSNRLVYLDEPTGGLIYDRPLKAYGGHFARMQVPWTGSFGERHIAYSTEAGLIALFRLSNGDLAWSHEHKATTLRAVIDRDRLYVTTYDGYLLAFEGEF